MCRKGKSERDCKNEMVRVERKMEYVCEGDRRVRELVQSEVAQV